VVVQNKPNEPSLELSALAVGKPDERGNTIKYIYARDPAYVVYYSRSADGEAGQHYNRGWSLRLLQVARLAPRPLTELAYETEGVQVQLTSNPAERHRLRGLLLPLGTERAKLQALLNGWRRRQSYDSSIATALQLALDGNGKADAALQTLKDAKASILSEREIAGKAQYFMCTLALGLCGLSLLWGGFHVLFKDLPNFWVGAQAGVFGAILSIAIALRGRTVLLDSGLRGNLSESALRLSIGAISGGTLVLLFATGLIPALHTVSADLNVTGLSGTLPDDPKTRLALTAFVVLLGIIAGFVDQLVPGLLEDQSKRFRDSDARPKTG
jgi:hypothetical protein